MAKTAQPYENVSIISKNQLKQLQMAFGSHACAKLSDGPINKAGVYSLVIVKDQSGHSFNLPLVRMNFFVLGGSMTLSSICPLSSS